MLPVKREIYHCKIILNSVDLDRSLTKAVKKVSFLDFNFLHRGNTHVRLYFITPQLNSCDDSPFRCKREFAVCVEKFGDWNFRVGVDGDLFCQVVCGLQIISDSSPN